MANSIYIALFFKYNESPTLARRAFRKEKKEIKCPLNDQKKTRIAETFKKQDQFGERMEVDDHRVFAIITNGFKSESRIEKISLILNDIFKKNFCS